MANNNKTSIEWADRQWNPYTWNCSKVSPGCKNCYALQRSQRWSGKNSNGGDFLKHPPIVREKAFGELRKFDAGDTIFVNTHSDTYHEGVPLSTIQRIHNTAASNPHLIFLFLTKRVERLYEIHKQLTFNDNIWIGTSVESQDYVKRLGFLCQIEAAGRFVSAEPLLSGITLKKFLKTGLLNWVIVGGESGANRRYFDKAWAKQLRDECREFGVPFLFKQGGAFKSGQDRLLEGRTWDETPFKPPESIEPEQYQLKLF